MDDLSGLDWSTTNTNANKSNKPQPMNSFSATKPAGANYSMSPMVPSASAASASPFASLRPSPSPQTSARNTPLSAQGSGFAAPKPTPAKPATDSFSNLVNFGTAKSNANLSLKERQEQLEAEKRRKQQEQQQKLQSQYGTGQFWDSLGQSSSTASRTASPAIPAPVSAKKPNDDDLFAAFNKDTKVDNASHYPPPKQLDLTDSSAWSQPSHSNGGDLGGDDDDDPFGLNQLQPKSQSQPTPQRQKTFEAEEDDDLLGDLGKPVDQVRRQAPPSRPQAGPGMAIEDSSSESDDEYNAPPSLNPSDPFDKAVAELVDMGFSPENARRGLTESGGGTNVQAAVGWLLDDAHRTARNKQSFGEPPAERPRADDGGRSRNNGGPAWMREGDLPPRSDNQSPATAEDLQKKAAAMGSSFLKTAGSLWKSGQKQVQKAVADFQQEGSGDPSQPKWMQQAQLDRMRGEDQQRPSSTDEAMMLDAGMRPEKPARPAPGRSVASRDQVHDLPSRPSPRNSPAPRWQQSAPSPPLDPRARLNKQVAEEQSAQAYVSPARRKKATPQPQPSPQPEGDLLFGSEGALPPKPQRSAQPSPSVPKRSPQPGSISPRPLASKRNIPDVASSVLQASTKHRNEGTAHFKRGDYDAAHTSYANALRGIPQTHPVCIVLLTNRALTALKTGSPKQAVGDADSAIGIIGSSRGEGEKVDLANGESRDMKELYGKALSRKAEALEQMEKWSEAGNVWQQCVEAGVGGASAAAGRQRCQTALAPKPKSTPKPAQARPKPSAAADLATQKNSEAVQRLRNANRAAEAADDERFALSEQVDARIAAWRDGKRDNLRALLGSLDTVLWEGSGWRKVGLHDLVLANKVKINYMKAIAKCHPDKLPQDANTEVKLVAAIVFATLNESWDGFKKENGL